MAAVSIVSATIPAERRDEVVGPFREMVGRGLPPEIRETFLVEGDDGSMAILTVWESRAALDSVRGGGEEPFARRVLREAGGQPEARFFDVVAEAPPRSA